MIDERYHELESGVKQKAEAAVAAQKPREDGTAVEKIQAKGSDEVKAATAGTEAYAAAPENLVKEAHAATAGSKAHAAAADAEADAAAAHNAAAAKNETKKRSDTLKSRSNKSDMNKDDEDDAAAAKKKNQKHRRHAEANENDKAEKEDDEIKRLIEERRSIAEGDKQRLKEVSKKIKKCIRDNKRSRRQEKIQRILEAFRGIKNISNIKSAKKETLIPKVNNEKGETVTSRKGIANVFGEFCSKLYAGNDLKKKSGTVTDMKQEMPEFTKNEVQAAIDSLKKRQSERQ